MSGTAEMKAELGGGWTPRHRVKGRALSRPEQGLLEAFVGE